MEEFFDLRYKFYGDRKAYLLKKMTKEYEILKNKSQFIEGIISGDLVIQNKKRNDTLNMLRDKGFKTWSEINAILKED